MEQFSLEKWLKDKSRKVVTRDGRPVRIVCWDGPDKVYPIVGFINNNPAIITWDNYGYHLRGHKDTIHDLFFADEEEKTTDDTEMNSLAYLTELGYTCIPPKKEDELTEFENTMVSFAHAMFDHLLDVTKEIDIKGWKDKLLELAKKELKKKFVLLAKEDAQTAFDLGKAEVLKDLPRWEKSYNNPKLSEVVPYLGDYVLYWKGYYIRMKDLEKLPKEE